MNPRLAEGVQADMTRLVSLRAGLLACLVMTPALLQAQRVGRWEYLGEANVDGKADHDRIKVGESKGTFSRIQILVQNSAVEFDRVVVHYANGEQHPVGIASRIPAGGKTREIDLPGVKRAIDSVEVWYQKGNWANAGKPKIRLMGIH